MKNFYKLKTISLFNNTYAYVDTPMYNIDDICISENFPVKFINKEFYKDGEIFIICFLKCNKLLRNFLETTIFPKLNSKLRMDFGDTYSMSQAIILLNKINGVEVN